MQGLSTPGTIESPPGKLSRGHRVIKVISEKARDISEKLNRHSTQAYAQHLTMSALANSKN